MKRKQSAGPLPRCITRMGRIAADHGRRGFRQQVPGGVEECEKQHSCPQAFCLLRVFGCHHARSQLKSLPCQSPWTRAAGIRSRAHGQPGSGGGSIASPSGCGGSDDVWSDVSCCGLVCPGWSATVEYLNWRSRRRGLDFADYRGWHRSGDRRGRRSEPHVWTRFGHPHRPRLHDKNRLGNRFRLHTF